MPALTFGVRTNSHIQKVDLFMIYLDTKFHMGCCHFLLTFSPIHHVLTDNYKNLNHTPLM